MLWLCRARMEWLDGVLHDATKLKQKVVVCCHLPLDPDATSSREAVMWNCNEFMDVIHHYSCVKVCLAVHETRDGIWLILVGYTIVFGAAVECPPGIYAFGYINVYDNRLSFVDTDQMESKDMSFDP